jgi:hypothetical protein
MANTMDPYGSILGFLYHSHYFFLHVAPQLNLQDWVGPIPDPLLLRKSGSAGNRTWNLLICSSIKQHSMKMDEGVAIQLHTFLTWALGGGDWRQYYPVATLSAVNKRRY